MANTIIAITEYRAAIVWTTLIACGSIVYNLLTRGYLLALFFSALVLIFMLSDVKSAFPYDEEALDIFQASRNYNRRALVHNVPAIDLSQARGLFESVLYKLEVLAEQKTRL